jgi:hypothetical protein
MFSGGTCQNSSASRGRSMASCQPAQIVGPIHARPEAGAVRGSGPARTRRNVPRLRAMPAQCQVGTEEQVH